MTTLSPLPFSTFLFFRNKTRAFRGSSGRLWWQRHQGDTKSVMVKDVLLEARNVLDIGISGFADLVGLGEHKTSEES